MSTETGQAAERAAADYLERAGQTIVGRNWRSRWSEIDIITRDESGSIHFVEVKYRRTAAFGNGFDYITTDKARRLRRAATAWMGLQQAKGDYQIDVIAVSGALERPLIELLENAIED